MEASLVIHPTMGRGHSNLCEANFTVLPQFRSKSQSLCRLAVFGDTLSLAQLYFVFSSREQFSTYQIEGKIMLHLYCPPIGNI